MGGCYAVFAFWTQKKISFVTSVLGVMVELIVGAQNIGAVNINLKSILCCDSFH